MAPNTFTDLQSAGRNLSAATHSRVGQNLKRRGGLARQEVSSYCVLAGCGIWSGGGATAAAAALFMLLCPIALLVLVFKTFLIHEA